MSLDKSTSWGYKTLKNCRKGVLGPRICYIWNLPFLWMKPVNSFYWLVQLELSFLLHVTESILTDRLCTGHRQCSAKSLGIPFPFSPHCVRSICIQWPVSITFLRGLFSGYWSCFAYLLRGPEVPWIYILPWAGLSHPPPSTLAWSPVSLPGVGQTLRHIFYFIVWLGICSFAGLLPFLIQHILFTPQFLLEALP